MLIYSGPLPEGLDWTYNNVKVVEKLGEPSGKPKANQAIPVYVDYSSKGASLTILVSLIIPLGVQIDFQHKSYEDLDNPMSSICIYKPT
jgi:hypothetical protein